MKRKVCGRRADAGGYTLGSDGCRQAAGQGWGSRSISMSNTTDAASRKGLTADGLRAGRSGNGRLQALGGLRAGEAARVCRGRRLGRAVHDVDEGHAAERHGVADLAGGAGAAAWWSVPLWLLLLVSSCEPAWSAIIDMAMSMPPPASIASWQWASVAAAVAMETDEVAGIECRTISTAMASPSQPRMGSRAIMRASSRVRMARMINRGPKPPVGRGPCRPTPAGCRAGLSG